jgi:hypothetical protein
MNPDLLYRINYGPVTKKESNTVATFLLGQFSDIKARQYNSIISPVAARGDLFSSDFQ